MNPPPKTGNSPARVDELDGLRGLLAIWVALTHILAWTGFWENPGPGRLNGAWLEFISAKPAVDTFIILSGFAISFLLHKKKQNYSTFMRGRFFRIYPVYILCLILGIAASFLTPAITHAAPWRDTVYFSWVRTLTDQENSRFGAHLLAHLTLLNGTLPKQILPGATGTFLTPAWSITLEWQYYLVAPFIARGVRSGTSLLALGFIAAAGIHFAPHWQNAQLSFLPPQLPLFLIGIGSYHLYVWLSNNRPAQPLPSLAAAGVILVAIISGWHSVALVAWALGFGCILVRGRDPLSRFLGIFRKTLLHPIPQHLGKISYPVYLVHWPVIIAALFLLLKLLPSVTSTAAFAILFVTCMPAILISAEIIHRTLEMPAMKFGKRFDRRPPAPTRTTGNPNP
ncbi:MAG: acyltransferase family protein [Verrucomicrobiota bacterium JB025]|nr:acyltransferase [Verrucomicrobiota bacterium JB025]